MDLDKQNSVSDFHSEKGSELEEVDNNLLNRHIIVEQPLELLDLQTVSLQFVFNEEKDKLLQELQNLKKEGIQIWKQTLLITFWLSIHLEKYEFANILSKEDDSIMINVKQIMKEHSRLISMNSKSTSIIHGTNSILPTIIRGQLNSQMDTDLQKGTFFLRR